METMKRVRIVFCGEASVGKSSLIKRFSSGVFNEGIRSTVGGAFHSSYVRHDGEVIALEVWDTAGSERYHSVIPSFFRNAAAVVIVFDLTSHETFEPVDHWREFAAGNAPAGARFFLVGNKADLRAQRTVHYEEGEGYADGNGFGGYLETSAKTGESVDTLFALLSEVQTSGIVDGEVHGEVIMLDKKGCC
jgi:small GTP-binding protein